MAAPRRERAQPDNDDDDEDDDVPGATAEQSEIIGRRMGARCVCFSMRKASRAVTILYDAAFRPLGLKATQATLLFSIQGMGPVPLARLAAHAVLDRTSLTRNLKPLVRGGLVSVENGSDGRVRIARLTPRGAAIVREALPIWDALQRRMEEALGDDRLGGLLAELTHVVKQVRPSSKRRAATVAE